MTPRRRRRVALVLLLVAGVGTATALALLAFRENVLFFFSPSDVAAGQAPDGHPFRMGGLVVDGSPCGARRTG
jgi:cytochrome c-type biogenesis protein CcmE